MKKVNLYFSLIGLLILVSCGHSEYYTESRAQSILYNELPEELTQHFYDKDKVRTSHYEGPNLFRRYTIPYYCIERRRFDNQTDYDKEVRRLESLSKISDIEDQRFSCIMMFICNLHQAKDFNDGLIIVPDDVYCAIKGLHPHGKDEPDSYDKCYVTAINSSNNLKNVKRIRFIRKHLPKSYNKGASAGAVCSDKNKSIMYWTEIW